MERNAALRPYLTTGIAVVGASVIAVAPVTVSPLEAPAAPSVVTASARVVSADVELTASLLDLIAAVPEVAGLVLQTVLQPLTLPAELETLAVELVKAFGPAITETVKVFTEQLPASALSLVAAGKFAHLAVLAANTVYTGTLTPIAPFAVAVMNALPLPFGTTSGVINEFLKLAINTPFVAGTTVLSLFAQVIDDGLSPVAALTGVIDAVSVAVASAVESIEKIAGALGGALPFSALAAPPDQPEARVSAAVDNAGSDVAFSSLPPAARTVTLSTNSAPPEADSIEAQPGGGEREASVDGAVSVNGATDLTDGNKVEPVAAAESEGAAADSGNENVEADEVTAPAGEVPAPDADSTDAGGEEDPSGE